MPVDVPVSALNYAELGYTGFWISVQIQHNLSKSTDSP